MNPFSTAAFTTLTGKLNDVFEEYASVAIGDMVGMQLFDVFDTDWQTWNSLTVYALGSASAVGEGAELPAISSAEGDSISITQQRIGARVIITKDLILFDRKDEMRKLVRSATQTTMSKIDQSYADLLLNGFTGTSYTDLWNRSQSNVANDGVVLFSASHTNNLNANTARNLIRNSAGTANPALDRAPVITARKDAMNYRDPNGVSRPINLNRLVVGPTNMDLAQRICYSTGVINTPNVDYNPIKGSVEVLPWSRLDQNSSGTDTSAYWFLADSTLVKDSLKSPFAQRPQMTAPSVINASGNNQWTLDAYYAIKAAWPFGIWGSTGAN